MPEAWNIESLDKRAVCQKRRRTATCPPQALDTLPAEWRELLARWVRRGGNSRWETLRKDAGTTSVQMADALLDWLLRSGWAAVDEQWKLSAWWPQHVELLHLPQLRAVLGLRDKDDEKQRWQNILITLHALNSDALLPAVLSLDELPVQRALARYDLILKLHEWQVQQQIGTRRDFSLFARGDTKSLSDSDWGWLESVLDLAEFRIERHTPLMLLAAPLQLHLETGQLDLSAMPDFAAFTPATLRAATTITGTVTHWFLVENRTSFERVARQREASIGVIWLPGFPPSWWSETMDLLLSHIPAPAKIACDPDPAGISIALKAAELWKARNLEWQPWKMSAEDLSSLHARKPLSETDLYKLNMIEQIEDLPPMLVKLQEWMRIHGEKGEQEGFL